MIKEIFGKGKYMKEELSFDKNRIIIRDKFLFRIIRFI
jgi:hypothetical protein